MIAIQAINRLKEAYADRVELITDTFELAKATLALEVWERAEKQYQGIMEAEALSYSTTGRSVSKRDIQAATNARNQARAELESYIGSLDGSTTWVNFGGQL